MRGMDIQTRIRDDKGGLPLASQASADFLCTPGLDAQKKGSTFLRARGPVDWPNPYRPGNSFPAAPGLWEVLMKVSQSPGGH